MVPIADHADVRRMLLAQKAYAEAGMALTLYCSRLVDERDTAPGETERARASLLLDVLTPVAKSWPSQWGPVANDLAIQVHGGYGYTRDFPVEQFYRDNRLNPIHEGTHGVQGIDLLGRKVVMRAAPGSTCCWTRCAPPSPGPPTRPPSPATERRSRRPLQRIAKTTATLHGAGDATTTLANASVYLEAVGHVVAAWTWLEQALVVGDRPGGFADGKRAAARYFFRWELPRTGPWFDLLDSLDTTTLDWTPPAPD